MKFLTLLIFLLPLMTTAQTEADYDKAMAKFQRFYNRAQGDSINAMFGRSWDETKLTHALWTDATAAERLKKHGKLKSFRFIGIDETDPNKVYVFETVFSKAGKKTTSLTLEDDLGLGTFRFHTTSDGIDELKKRKSGSHISP